MTGLKRGMRSSSTEAGRLLAWIRYIGHRGGKTGLRRDTAHKHGQGCTKDGYDLPITRALSEALDIPIIASGGAGNIEHMYDAFTRGKADAALAASIFHFGEYTIGRQRST